MVSLPQGRDLDGDRTAAGAYHDTTLGITWLADATTAVEDYRLGVYGMAIFVIVAVLYFALYSRKPLVADSPEEHAALTKEHRVAYNMDAD